MKQVGCRPSLLIAETPLPSPSGMVFRVLRGSAIYGLANFGTKAINLFLLVPLFTRFLTPSEYGKICLAESVAVLVVAISTVSLDVALRRLYFQYSDNLQLLRRYVSSVLRSAAVLLVLSLGVALACGRQLFAIFAPNFAIPFFPYTALAIMTAIAAQVVQYRLVLFQVEGRAKHYAMLALCVFVLTGAAAVLLVVFVPWGAYGMLLAKLVGTGASAVGAAFLLKQWFWAGWEWPFVRESLRFSLPLVPFGLTALVLDVADRFILQHFRPTAEVGLYTVAYTFGMVMFLVTLSLWQAFSPVYFETARSIHGGRVLGRLSSGLIVLLVAIAIFGALVAQDFVRWILAPRYFPAGRLIPLIIAAYLFHALFSVFQLSVLQNNRTVLLFLVSTVALSVNIATNLLLIPRWGMFGAAYANLGTFALEAVLMYVWAQRAYPLCYNGFTIIAAIVLLLVVLTLTQLPWSNSVRPIAMGLSLIIAILTLTTMSAKDLSNVFAMFARAR